MENLNVVKENTLKWSRPGNRSKEDITRWMNNTHYSVFLFINDGFSW